MASKYIEPVSQGISRGYGGAAKHNGIDYLSPVGTPVKASGDGVVEFEGWGQNHSWITWMGGITVLIKHDDGYSGYAHLSRTIVDKGQRVKQGQVIGYTGNTGNSTGPHLHFEFLPLSPNFNNGYSGRVNPSTYFAKTIGKPSNPTTGGGATLNESDLTALYRYGPLSLGGYLSRSRKSKEGSDVYLGKSAAFVITDFFNSKEAKDKRAAEKKRVQDLTRQRDDYKKQLDAANRRIKQLETSGGSGGAAVDAAVAADVKAIRTKIDKVFK